MCHMNVRWLTVLQAIEKEPVAADPQQRGHSTSLLLDLQIQVLRLAGIPEKPSLSPARVKSRPPGIRCAHSKPSRQAPNLTQQRLDGTRNPTWISRARS
jgi:hypothetical protein